MSEMPSVVTERMDNIPLLVAQMRRMDLPALIDSYFVTQGNRGGAQPGLDGYRVADPPPVAG